MNNNIKVESNAPSFQNQQPPQSLSLSPASHISRGKAESTSEISKLMRLNISTTWNSCYEKRTGLTATDWTSLNDCVQRLKHEWGQKFTPGDFVRLHKNSTNLPRTLHIFRTQEGRFYIVALLKTKNIEALDIPITGLKTKLALDLISGELFAEQCMPIKEYDSDPIAKEIFGKRGIMYPEVFRGIYKKDNDERMFSLQKLYADNFQNLLLNGKKKEIDQCVKGLNEILLDARKSDIDLKIFKKDSWFETELDFFHGVEYYSDIHPTQIQGVLPRFRNFFHLLKKELITEEVNWQFDPKQESTFAELLKKLYELSAEALKARITDEEKIIIVEDMIYGLIAMKQGQVSHQNIYLEKITLERGADGKIIKAFISDFSDSSKIDPASREIDTANDDVNEEMNDEDGDETMDPNPNNVISKKNIQKENDDNGIKIEFKEDQEVDEIPEDISEEDEEEDSIDIKSMGESLSYLFYDRLGEDPESLPEDAVPAPFTIERIVYDMATKKIINLEGLQKALFQIQQIKKSFSKDKDDSKKN
jgi:hypothetical protein